MFFFHYSLATLITNLSPNFDRFVIIMHSPNMHSPIMHTPSENTGLLNNITGKKRPVPFSKDNATGDLTTVFCFLPGNKQSSILQVGS